MSQNKTDRLKSAFQECCNLTVTPPVLSPLYPFEWATIFNKCSCPKRGLEPLHAGALWRETISPKPQ